MRVYTRGVDEGLMIGKNVQVNVLEVQADCVRLAIIDPDASPSYREEVLYLPSDNDQFESVDRYSIEYEPSFSLSDHELAVSSF